MASLLLIDLGVADRLVGVDSRSARRPELARLPIVSTTDEEEIERIAALAPDLIVLTDTEEGSEGALARAGRRVVIARAHDFDDGYALWRELGSLVGLGPLMHDIVRERTSALARLAALRRNTHRPRVAAIASLDPLAIVGGHAFIADLIELAGGENVAHGREERTIELDHEQLNALEPVLVLYATESTIGEEERRAVTERTAGIAPVAFLTFDPDLFFTDDTLEAARVLGDRLDRLAR